MNAKGKSNKRKTLHNWSSENACTAYTENRGIVDATLFTWVKQEVWCHFQVHLVDNLHL